MSAPVPGVRSHAELKSSPSPSVQSCDDAHGGGKVYTVSEAIDHMGFGWFQLKLSMFTGLIWMTDAMEMMIMSILSPAAKCYFHLTDFEVAFITTFVFIGVFIGSVPFGWIMDKYGRHHGILLGSFFVGVFGILSGFSPNYYWLLFLRFMVGVNISCTPQAMTYYSEFLPSKSRSRCIVFIEVFWSIGTVFETLLSMLVMPHLGWRYLLCLSSLPVVISVPVFWFFPKSPLYLISIGDIDGAEATLQRVAKSNGKQLPPGRLVSNEEKEKLLGLTGKEGQDGTEMSQEAVDENIVLLGSNKDKTVEMSAIKNLFMTKKIALTTILLWILWFTVAFIYYGVVLLTTEVLSVDLVVNGTCIDTIPTTEQSCVLSTSDYLEVLWTTAAEFPGLIITVLLVDFFGRRRTLTAEMFGITLFYGLLLLCHADRIVTLMFIFGVRGLVTGAFQASYIYTPEVYPTHFRAVGLGCASAMARLGALTTPFVAEVVMVRSLYRGKLFYTIISGLAAFSTLFFPFETSGKSLE